MSSAIAQEKLRAGMAALRRGLDIFLESWAARAFAGVPALNYMTGAYDFDETYIIDREWCWQWAGFLAGKLWLMYAYTGDAAYHDGAFRLVERLGPRLAQTPHVNADAGFDIYYALCLGHAITGDAKLRDLAVAACKQMNPLYLERVGAFTQMVPRAAVVIDTASMLLPLFWAERYEPGLRDKAIAHNRCVLRLGLVRDGGRSIQRADVDPDTGRVIRRHTVQGWQETSVWTRGQAWGIHGFTSAFEGTGDPEFLHAALELANWYLAHVPPDGVPYYDLEDPDRRSIPRDSCSAAIACAALLRLARSSRQDAARFRAAAESTLGELLRNYLSPGGVLLHGSWGRIGLAADLGRFPQEDVMPYGNYWIVEALYRFLVEDWSVFALGAGPVGTG